MHFPTGSVTLQIKKTVSDSLCSVVVSEPTKTRCYILPVQAYRMNGVMLELCITYMCMENMFCVVHINTTAGSLVCSSILTPSLPKVTSSQTVAS
jgi:hypothetical protein